MAPMAPSGLSRLSPPPNQKAMRASIVRAAAIIAAMELIKMSRLLTWASSWASTPSSSSTVRISRIPVVTATAAFFGERPVAKALGWGESMM